MSLTAKEIDEKIQEAEWTDEKEYGYEDVYEYMWSEEENTTVEGVGLLEHIETSGGEGDGAGKELVFKLNGKFYEKTGYYSSWGDEEFDGELYEVVPVEVTRVEYVKAEK